MCSQLLIVLSAGGLRWTPIQGLEPNGINNL